MDPQNNHTPQGGNPQKASDNTLLFGILSYLGPLVIISYAMAKDNPTVKFHVKQGLAVFGLEVIVWLLGSLMWQLWILLNLINLFTIILSVIGIINASQNKQKMLPLVGQFANGFNI